MYTLLQNLLRGRLFNDGPVQIGIVGAGKFGTGLAVQLAAIDGINVGGVADLELRHARHAWTAAGVPDDAVREVESASAVDDCIRNRQPCVLADGAELARSEIIELVVDATGSPLAGALIASTAIEHGKHVVMVNVEADTTIGSILRRRADSKGLVYTLVDGDQPGAIMNLVNWARLLGFEVVAAGRGTIMHADDRAGTPDTVQERFGFTDEQMARRTINTRMYNSFRDGTKAQVEMTALANMAGLVPDVRGMHERSVSREQIPAVYCGRAAGGILGREGVVELANSVDPETGAPLTNGLGMGVFAVFRAEHAYVQEDLLDYMGFCGGNGDTFLLWRPYHLVAVTAPLTIMRAVLMGEATGKPAPLPVADVITVAKTDLKAGTELDGGGGYTVVGLSERADVAAAQGLLPLGLCAGARLRRPVARGAAIARQDVDMPPPTLLHRLRAEQDRRSGLQGNLP